MKLTIAICTWNRDAMLSQALASICRATPPRTSQWEIIVVNNNCTDGTDAVVNQFSDRLPIILVHEPKPGLSNARNTAIDAASGDYIIWTDDDVRVHVDWIVEYERAFAKWPEPSFFGGAIFPLFEGKPPSWIQSTLPYVSIAFSIRDVHSGMASITSASADLPFRANFAVRAEEQRRFRYDPRLGLRPGTLIVTGEETAVIRDILAEGSSGLWLPYAAVDHWIPRSRQTISYLRSYYEGKGWMLGTGLWKSQHKMPSGGRLTLWCLALLKELRYRVYRLTTGPKKWAPALKSASLTWGMLASRR